MVRIDLSARRICRLDVVDFVVFPDDDESDFGRETGTVANVGESATAADAATAMSDTPLMCFKKNREGEMSFHMQLGILERVFLKKDNEYNLLEHLRKKHLIHVTK